MHNRKSCWKGALADQSGTVIILFALMVVPIAGLMAGALDFARQMSVDQELQESLDSAALAAAKHIHANWNGNPDELAAVQEEANAVGTQMFLANFKPSVGVAAPQPLFTFDGDRVSASADADFPASFLGIVGVSHLGAAGFAEAVIPPPMNVEIVLVLDYSGSMKDKDKYVRMANAATAFLEKVVEDSRGHSLIGLVPFSDFVLTSIKGQFVRDVEPSLFATIFEICISNRDYPYSTTDETPTGASASKWRGVGLPEGSLTFAGQLSSGFEGTLYGNKDLGDLLSGCTAMANRNLELLDLTSDVQLLIDSIAAMQPHEYTNIALGAEIGWHMLTSNEPYTRGTVDSEDDTKKVMILLSDGMQTIPAHGPSGTSIDAANENIAEVCDNMVHAGIRVFTIAYDVEDEFTRNLLSECSSGPSYYFEPTASSDLGEVFDRIFENLVTSVWLAR